MHGIKQNLTNLQGKLMSTLNSTYLPTRYYYDQSSIASAEGVKERCEAETKERALPFDVVKFALANLPQGSKLSSSALEERVSRILTGLSSDNSCQEDLPILEALKNANNPELQQSMEKLIELYRQINNKINKMELERKNLYLANLAKELFIVGDFDKALDLVNTMGHCGDHKNESLCEFAKKMIKMGNFEKAFEYTKAISDDAGKDTLISIVIGSLLKPQHLGGAIKFLDIVTDRKMKTHLFRKISSFFVQDTRIENLVDLVNKMPYDERDYYTLEIAFKNISAENLEKSISLVNTLLKPSSKGLAFWNISIFLKREGNLTRASIFFEKACELYKEALVHIEQDFIEAKRIADVTVRDEYLRILASTLFFYVIKSNIDETVVIERVNEASVSCKNETPKDSDEENGKIRLFDKILEIVQKMSTKCRDSYIKKRTVVLLDLNLIDEASKFCKLMNNSQQKRLVLQEIHNVANKKDVNIHASEFFNAEPSDKRDHLVFKSIDEILEEDFEVALKISNAMIDNAVKALTLLKISNYLQERNFARASIVFGQAHAAFNDVYEHIYIKIAKAHKMEDVIERDQVYEIIILALLFDITVENLEDINKIIEAVSNPTLKNILRQKMDDLVAAFNAGVDINELDHMLFSKKFSIVPKGPRGDLLEPSLLPQVLTRTVCD
jgi:tetratricopeptide (TPR) repeat protein